MTFQSASENSPPSKGVAGDGGRNAGSAPMRTRSMMRPRGSCATMRTSSTLWRNWLQRSTARASGELNSRFAHT